MRQGPVYGVRFVPAGTPVLAGPGKQPPHGSGPSSVFGRPVQPCGPGPAGGLTDEPGTGMVDAAASLDRYGQIPRDDVAATLVACLDEPATVGKAFDLLAGETPIADALAAL